MHRDGQGGWCAHSDNGAKVHFDSVSNQPVLIDFENSIVSRDEIAASGGASLIEGRPLNRSLLKRILYGTNRVELDHARRLSALLIKKTSRPRILVIGGATVTPGIRHLLQADAFDIVSFDIYASANTDFVADAHAIPLADASFDAVWIQAVLEHVLVPDQVVAEIERVLVPQGIVYAETPFLQPVHEKAYDFTRFTESGHRWLFRRFAVIESGVVSGAGATLFQILRYFAGAVLRNRKLGSLAASPFFWLRFLDWVIPATHASDLASGVFFLGQKNPAAIASSEMPTFFKGVK